MEEGLSKQQAKFAEQLKQLVNMEDMARRLLSLAIAAGNAEMQVAARTTLARAAEQIGAMVISPEASGGSHDSTQ